MTQVLDDRDMIHRRKSNFAGHMAGMFPWIRIRLASYMAIGYAGAYVYAF